MEKLKLDGYKHDKRQSLRTFITNFLKTYNREYHTLYAEGENEGLLQTPWRCSRSLGDITAICNYYYPDTTKEEVKEILLGSGKNLVGHYCSDIHKRVYEHLSIHPGWVQADNGMFDEYGDEITYNDYEDKNT
jgi:hypothetical protein